MIESTKVLCNELQNIIIKRVMRITLTNLDSCHKVTHKYISHLGKFNENIDKFFQWQNANKFKQNLQVTYMFIV